jgi:protein TonB
MTAVALHASQVPHFQLSWPRVGAWSGSFSLHLLIVALLLTPPVVLQLTREAPIDHPQARIIEVIPPTVIPDLPQPVRHQTIKPIKSVPVPVVTPVAQRQTEMSYSAPAIESPPSIESKSSIPDSAPSAITYGNRTRVTYPKESLINREQGTVILRVLVGVDGVPQTIEIEKSSGFLRLDRAARDAVKGWSFHPAMHGGLAASAWALVPVTFNLQTL